MTDDVFQGSGTLRRWNLCRNISLIVMAQKLSNSTLIAIRNQGDVLKERFKGNESYSNLDGDEDHYRLK